MRSRLEIMWKGNDVLLAQQQQQLSGNQYEDALHATADSLYEDALHAEVSDLKEQLAAANERAERAEERAAAAEAQIADLSLLPAKLEMKSFEVNACRSMLDAQTASLVRSRAKAEAVDAQVAAVASAAKLIDPPVLVLLPEAPPRPRLAAPRPTPPTEPSLPPEPELPTRQAPQPQEVSASLEKSVAAAAVAEATSTALERVASSKAVADVATAAAVASRAAASIIAAALTKATAKVTGAPEPELMGFGRFK